MAIVTIDDYMYASLDEWLRFWADITYFIGVAGGMAGPAVAGPIISSQK